MRRPSRKQESASRRPSTPRSPVLGDVTLNRLFSLDTWDVIDSYSRPDDPPPYHTLGRAPSAARRNAPLPPLPLAAGEYVDNFENGQARAM